MNKQETKQEGIINNDQIQQNGQPQTKSQQKKESQKQDQFFQQPIDMKQKEEYQDLENQKFIQSDLIKSQSYKKMAATLFSNKQYSDAIDLYRNALQYCSSEVPQQRKFKAILYSNIAISFSKRIQSDVDYRKQVVKYCRKSIKQDEKYYKSWVNLGKYQQQLQQFEQALEAFKKAHQIDKENGRKQHFVQQKIASLSVKVNQLNEKRKQQVLNGLKTIGNSFLGYFGMSLDNFKLQKGQNGGYSVQFNQK